MSHATRRLIGLALTGIFTLTACGGGGQTPAAAPPCAADTRTCYVTASGRDTNSGADPADALATVSKAAHLALDGYTIIVGPGTYPGGITTRSLGAAPRGIKFIADPSGTLTQDPQAGPVVIDATLAGGSAQGFNLPNSAPLSSGGVPPGSLIDGFTITGAPDAGIVLKSGSNDFTIQNCTVFNNPGDGIRVQDSAGVLVFNNLVYRNGGDGISIVGVGSGSPNARVYSNTVAANTGHGITLGTTKAASPDASLHNNIVQDNDSTAPQESIKAITSPRSDVFPENDFPDFNLVSPPTYNPTSLQGPNDVTAPALFVDDAGGDFHVRQGSPVINAGGALNVDDSLVRILQSRTVLVGGSGDNGPLDIGFHYPRQ